MVKKLTLKQINEIGTAAKLYAINLKKVYIFDSYKNFTTENKSCKLVIQKIIDGYSLTTIGYKYIILLPGREGNFYLFKVFWEYGPNFYNNFISELINLL